MNIDRALQIMELERQIAEDRMRHELRMAKYQAIQETTQAAINIYVGLLNAQLQALAWGLMRAGSADAQR